MAHRRKTKRKARYGRKRRAVRRNPRRGGYRRSAIDRTQLRIARQTLRMHPALVPMMGGTSQAEAREIIKRLSGRKVGRNPARCKHVWGPSGYGGSHPGYCTVSGMHMVSRCKKCGTRKVICPTRKGHYYDPEGSGRGNWGRNPQQQRQSAWDVYLNGKLIDTVYYSLTLAPEYSAADVKHGLVEHDGYDPRIVVRRRTDSRGRSRNPGFSSIRPGSTVVFRQYAGMGRGGPEYKRAKGRAVMKGPHGWVLNTGGRYGTPAVVDETNFVGIGGRWMLGRNPGFGLAKSVEGRVYRSIPTGSGYASIQPGDIVYFTYYHGGKGRGRAVMRGPGGWVLNTSARGTPAIVDERNFVSVSHSKRRTGGSYRNPMKLYRTFLRSATGWESFAKARKRTVATGQTYSQAQDACRAYNEHRTPAEIRRGTKMEFEAQ